MVSYSFSVAFSSARGVYGVLVSQRRSVVPMVSTLSYSFSVAVSSARGVYGVLQFLSGVQ